MDMITFEDFKKIEFKIGKIKTAEKVEGSEKLVKLMVDIGEKDENGTQKNRQILAGISKFYEPEVLVDREIVVVTNLEPRMMMGQVSQGMLLAADDNGPVLLSPEREVTPGANVR